MVPPLRKRSLLALCIGLSWGIISLHPVWKFLPAGGAIAVTLLSVAAVAFGVLLADHLRKRSRQIGMGWFAGLFFLLLIAFAIFHPRSYKQSASSRSDREDALRVELQAVLHHQDPFATHTFLNNPPTPLPGAMLLALPFYAVGHIAWQNIFWYALFFAFTLRIFPHRATALFFLTAFVVLSPTSLSDFVSGGDYLTNLFYVVIALGCFAFSLEHSQRLSLVAAAAVGIVLISRGVYLLTMIPLLALALQRRTRSQTAAIFAVLLGTAAAVALLPLAPHPVSRLVDELHQTSVGKLRYIPHVLQPQWSLPLLAAIVSCAAFRMRLNFHRILLFLGVTNGILLVPAVLPFVMHGAWQRLSYLAACCLPLVLWSLEEFEPGVMPAATT